MLNHRSDTKQPDVSSIPRPIENGAAFERHQDSTPSTSPSAVIGPKIRFKGELVGEEELLVQGKIEGTIDLKGHALTVGDQGIVEANVKAHTITIQGNVKGDLRGEERISITSSSNVQGNIKAARVVLEDGAKFRGSIDMDMDEPPASVNVPSKQQAKDKPTQA